MLGTTGTPADGSSRASNQYTLQWKTDKASKASGREVLLAFAEKAKQGFTPVLQSSRWGQMGEEGVR